MARMKGLKEINIKDKDGDGIPDPKDNAEYAELAISNAYNEQLMDECKEKVLALMKKTVRPEFLNRIDEIIMFRPLGKEEIRGILRLQISQAEKLLESQGITLNFSDKALDYLANKGFDVAYGARPIKRLLQKEVINSIAKALIAGKIAKGSTIKVDYMDGTLTFS